jgi:hypothetical protein
MLHSLLSCGKWWRTRHCGPSEYQIVKCDRSDILDSDHLPIVFHILDHVITKNLSEPVEKFTDWEMSQSLASDLISPIIEINSEEEADKRRATLQPL